jgi:hypothetical protein
MTTIPQYLIIDMDNERVVEPATLIEPAVLIKKSLRDLALCFFSSRLQDVSNPANQTVALIVHIKHEDNLHSNYLYFNDNMIYRTLQSGTQYDGRWLFSIEAEASPDEAEKIKKIVTSAMQ